ncbi:MAG: hypothetical protein Q9170_006381, partial [Blastenia crenularia]
MGSSLTALKADLIAVTRTNHDLSSQISTHTTQESYISDLEVSLSDLQTRYESKDRSHRQLHLGKTDLSDALEKANKRLAAQSTENAILKETKKTLQSDLEQARHDLLNSDRPDLVRLTTAESQARASAAEVTALDKKYASLTSDLEFARQAYQSASTSAADLAAQVTQLKSLLETAERKARGEAAHLAAVNRDNAVREAKRQVRQLKVALEERDK